jgi:hypothetical protein
MLNQINPNIFPRYESAASAFARLNFKRFQFTIFASPPIYMHMDGDSKIVNSNLRLFYSPNQ